MHSFVRWGYPQFGTHYCSPLLSPDKKFSRGMLIIFHQSGLDLNRLIFDLDIFVVVSFAIAVCLSYMDRVGLGTERQIRNTSSVINY
jgi:hypothetical protein